MAQVNVETPPPAFLLLFTPHPSVRLNELPPSPRGEGFWMFRRVNGKRSAGADLLIIRQNEAWCDNGLCAVNAGFLLAGEDADRAADERFKLAFAGVDHDGGDK